MRNYRPLRLKAENPEDIQILSAALQDAIGQLGDFIYVARQRRFSMALNRYRWEDRGSESSRGERVRSAIQIDSVLSVKSRNIRLGASDAFVSLLAVEFEPGEEPGGQLRLVFSGDGEIVMDVECLDILMADISNPWKAGARPGHPDDESS